MRNILQEAVRLVKTINFITSTLPAQHGGRTKSLLQRARIFTDNNMKVIIYTTNYHQNYDLIYKHLYKNSAIDNKTEMINIFDYYRYSEKNVNINYKLFLTNELKKYYPNLVFDDMYEFKKHPEGVTYYYENGRTVYHISRHACDGGNKVKNIDLYLPCYKRSIVRCYTDYRENIHKIRYFQAGTDIVISDVFVDTELKPYLIKEYSYLDENQILDRIILFKKDKTSYVFRKEKDFFKYWYDEIFSDGDIIINDARLLDKPLLECKRDVKRIFQLHSSHLGNPLIDSCETKNSFKTLFTYPLKKTDTIVSLTTSQKGDILKTHHNLASSIVVIPHSLALKEMQFSANDKQICIVARLSPEKRLEDAVEAFYLFNQRIKDYKLVIYGDGEEKEKLDKLIRNRGLENNITLMGRTDEPHKIFQESIFSIVSSIYEGFTLAILESIANGCPVISYNLRYGPSDILDEHSGRITEINTPDALCQEMLLEIQQPKDRKVVRKRAEKFSTKSFMNEWKKLIT